MKLFEFLNLGDQYDVVGVGHRHVENCGVEEIIVFFGLSTDVLLLEVELENDVCHIMSTRGKTGARISRSNTRTQ